MTFAQIGRDGEVVALILRLGHVICIDVGLVYISQRLHDKARPALKPQSSRLSPSMRLHVSGTKLKYLRSAALIPF